MAGLHSNTGSEHRKPVRKREAQARPEARQARRREVETPPAGSIIEVTVAAGVVVPATISRVQDDLVWIRMPPCVPCGHSFHFTWGASDGARESVAGAIMHSGDIGMMARMESTQKADRRTYDRIRPTRSVLVRAMLFDVAGVGRADSLAWDPHKMLSLPLASGALLLRDERRLDAAFAQHAEYLFHDRSERVYDQGVRSFQCSRRGDALKLWVAWQRHGTEGLGALYDHLCATTAAFHAAVEEHPAFDALHRPEANILCFAHRGGRDEELREAWNASGRGHLSLTRLDGRPVLRVTIMNPFTTPEHCRATLDGLASL